MQPARHLVLAYLVLMPWIVTLLPGTSFSEHDYSRIAEVVLMCACAASLAATARPPALWRPGRTGGLLLAGAGVLATVAILRSAAPLWAFMELALLTGMACIAWTVASARTLDGLKVDATAVAAGVSLYGAVHMLLALLSLWHQQPLPPSDFHWGYVHRRFMNHAQTVMLPVLAVIIGWQPCNAWVKRLAWVGLATGFALVAYSGGRATTLALGVGALATWVAFGKAAAPMIRIITLGAVAGIVICGLLFFLAPMLLGLPTHFNPAARVGDVSSVSTRLYIWSIAISQALSSPLWGIGPMHFSHHPNYDAAHPHNIFLQLAAEWGIPVMLLAAVGFFQLMRTLRRQLAAAAAAGGQVPVALFMAVSAVLVDSLFSGNLVMPVSQVWVAALLGWTLAWVRLAGQAEKPGAGSLATRSRGWACCALAVQAALLGIVLWQCAHWPDIGLVESPNPVSNPRFWMDGWF